MKKCVKVTGRLAVFAAVAILAGPAAWAQVYPSKAIHIIVPFAPGSILDTVSRLVGPKMSEAMGQPVIVENRAGAGGAIGTEMVAKSPPDGHMIVLGSSGTHMAAIYLTRNLPYDPVKDFTPISMAVEPVSCMIVSASIPVASVQELVDYAKKNPGKLSYASNGVGSVFHLIGELFKQAGGVDVLHVPLKGASEVMNSVLGGHIPVGFASVAGLSGPLSSGKIKVLAVLTTAPYSGLPGIPPLAQAQPGFDFPGSWLGFFGPARLPQPVLARLNGEIVKGLTAPDVRPKLDGNALRVVANTPQEFAAAQKSGIEAFGRAVRLAGIKPE